MDTSFLKGEQSIITPYTYIRFYLVSFAEYNTLVREDLVLITFASSQGSVDKALIIKIYQECKVGIEKSVTRTNVWHHEACQVMTKGDLKGRISYPTNTQIMDSFSC